MRIAPAILLCTILAASGAQAQFVKPMEEWKFQRDVDNLLSDQACNGDRDAYETLVLNADPQTHNSPTAQVALAWVIVTKDCGRFYTGDQKMAFSYNVLAARSGYPVAISNAGFRLIEGLGVAPDPKQGVELVVLATEGGYGAAGARLARHYIHGKYLARDLAQARLYLEMADRLDTDEALMTEVWSLYHKAMGNL